MTLLLDWPFFALAAGVAGLLALLFMPRRTGSPPRRRDPAWLVSLMLPVYMIHQFEEHGFDLLGRRFHFLVDMCGMLGHSDIAHCPADSEFIFAVNVGGVWIAGLCAILWRRSNPMVGACAFGIPLVNGVAHLGPAIAHGTYNSGLLTGALVFLPLSVYVLRALFRARILTLRRLPIVIASGLLVHAILMGALMAYAHSLLPRAAMLAVEVANGFVPLLLGTLVGPREKQRA